MARRGRFGSFLVYLIGSLVVAGAAFTGVRLWQDKDAQLVASREAMAEGLAKGPAVQVATIALGPKERLITLLGDTRPYQVATLYGKVAGYLKSIAVDRGDHVRSGQVVAEVESAETDRQYDAAVSDLENKKKNAEREHDLVARGWTSVQSADLANAVYRMAQANMEQQAVMKSYEILRAPFDGTVTARFVDVGAMVQSSITNQTSNQPVITIADMSQLRIDVYVEQKDVPYVHVGDLADVADGANPDRKMQARIARTSDQLDPRTRTLFTELDVDNSQGFLVPGAFAYVTLHVPVPSYPEIPVAGLVVRGTNTFIASVGADSMVRLQPVKVATTDGMRVSLAEGGRVGERVALNLPDEVSDGSRIRPIENAR
ncbi:MAG TPA: efflux RND transporter periplasmic adaptor subunit [Acetobacteraceae bacterium]|nr:efflux RND transporter periplasmic adaptor subunit [Acetobacteraceae bacterium]